MNIFNITFISLLFLLISFFSWDEWVDDTRILKYNDENKEIQTQIRAEHKKNSKRKEKKGKHSFKMILF